MHEVSLARKLAQLVDERAAAAAARRVLRINVALGAGSHIDPATFPAQLTSVMQKDSPAKHAALKVRRVPPQFTCATCERLYSADGADLSCPICGGMGRLTRADDELWLESLEVEL